MEKNFFLPSQLEDKYPEKMNIELDFDDFIYEKGMIPVKYEYKLDKDDVNFLVKSIAETVGLNADGSLLYKFLLDIYDYDDDLSAALEGYLEYSTSPRVNEIRNKLKEFCKSKAYNEFLDSFKYWVDEDELGDYYETEEIDDFN